MHEEYQMPNLLMTKPSTTHQIMSKNKNLATRKSLSYRSKSNKAAQLRVYNEPGRLARTYGTQQRRNSICVTPEASTTRTNNVTLLATRKALHYRRMYDAFSKTFYWRSMAANVVYIVRNCTSSAQNIPRYRHGRNMHIFPASGPLELTTMNVVGPFPKSVQGS